MAGVALITRRSQVRILPSLPTKSRVLGGPILDLSGNVVGIVSSGLSKKYADPTGHIAQNVNFAVKPYVAKGFLSANGVDFERAESVEDMKTADIAEKAERFTVLVGLLAVTTLISPPNPLPLNAYNALASI